MEEKENFELPKADYKVIIDFVMKYPVVLIAGGLLLSAVGVAVKMFSKPDNKVINLKK